MSDERTCQGCGEQIPTNRFGRPRKWCSDRCRKVTVYSRPCLLCGRETRGLWCLPCGQKVGGAKAGVTNARKNAPTRRMIEAMWADGCSTSEIRSVTGVTGFQPGSYRAEGWDLPRRYRTDEGGRRISGCVHA